MLTDIFTVVFGVSILFEAVVLGMYAGGFFDEMEK